MDELMFSRGNLYPSTSLRLCEQLCFVVHSGTQALAGTLRGGGRGLPSPQSGSAVNLKPGPSGASLSVKCSWKQSREDGLCKDLRGAARIGPGTLLSLTIIPSRGLNVPWTHGRGQLPEPDPPSHTCCSGVGGGGAARWLNDQRQLRALCSRCAPFPAPLSGVTLGLPHFLNFCSFNYMLLYSRGQHQDSLRPVIFCQTRSWELMHSSGTLAICSGSFHLDQDPLEGAGRGHILKRTLKPVGKCSPSHPHQ